MMTCQRTDELILDALDEPLNTQEQTEVDAHLATCPACVGSLRSYVATIGLLGEIGRAEESQAAPPLSDALVRRILDARAAAATDQGSRQTG